MAKNSDGVKEEKTRIAIVLAAERTKNTVCNVAHEDKHPTWKNGKQHRGKTRDAPDLVLDFKEDDVAELWGDSWGEGGNDNVVATPFLFSSCCLSFSSASYSSFSPSATSCCSSFSYPSF